MITINYTPVEYLGTGLVSVYPYPWRIFAETDLRVCKVDLASVCTELVLNVDYSVNGVDASSGGYITLLAGALPLSYRLTIESRIPALQTVDIANQGTFFPRVHELAFDKIVRMLQQLVATVGVGLSDANVIRLGDRDTDDVRRWQGRGLTLANLGNPAQAQDAVTLAALETYVGGYIEAGTAVFPGFWQITGDGATLTYTLSGTDNSAGASEIFLLVVVGGVVQEPGVAYTFDPASKQILFTAAIPNGIRAWVVQLGYARGLAIPPIYTLETDIPAAATAYSGREIRVKLLGAPEERRLCMQKADGSWVWQTSAVAPPF